MEANIRGKIVTQRVACGCPQKVRRVMRSNGGSSADFHYKLLSNVLLSFIKYNHKRHLPRACLYPTPSNPSMLDSMSYPSSLSSSSLRLSFLPRHMLLPVPPAPTYLPFSELLHPTSLSSYPSFLPPHKLLPFSPSLGVSIQNLKTKILFLSQQSTLKQKTPVLQTGPGFLTYRHHIFL